jgi:outer membrane receptor protein involved in Fe transport
MPVRPALWSIAIVLAIGDPVAAQRVTGAIEGTVAGEVGNDLPGVTVSVHNRDTGLRRSAVTDPDGRYAITSLPVEGLYEVQAELTGYVTVVNKTVTLTPNETLVIDFAMRVAVLESVTVTAATPPVDLGRSTVQQTINEPLVRTLPLLGRNFIHLASLTAGFTGNPGFPSPQGQVFWANNVLVDGASHFSKWRSAARTFTAGYGLESIKEVQVLANRFSAEFGEALATVTSAVTKAGTNDLRGAGLLFVQDDALNATPTFAIRKPPLSAQQFGFTLGGPFVKDRTHFFGSYEGRRSRNHNIVVSPAALGVAVPDNEDEHLGFFRVDHQRGQRQLITTRYNGQSFRWHREIGGLGLPGTGTAYTNDVHTILLTDALSVSSRLLNETRVQFARYVDTRFDLQPTVYVSRAGYSTEGGALGRFGFGADPEDTLEGADTLSFWTGPHTLKSGGGAKYVRSHNAFLNAGRGAYSFAGPPDRFPAPSLFVQGLAPTDDAAFADPRSFSAFGFVQDDWTIAPTLTLNLGLRYDIERVYHLRNYAVPVDKNNVQPRLGAAWDPGGRGWVIVRGGVGVYTQQQLLYYINRVQLEGPDGTVTLSLSPDSPLFPGYPNVLTALTPGAVLPPRDIQVVDATFTNPYSLQATAGIERTLFGVVIAADYVYLHGRDLMSLIDANAPASNVKPAQRSVAQADATRPLGALPNGYRKIITLGNLGESWYHALQIKARRSTGRLQTIVSYTLSDAEDLDNYLLPEDSRNLPAERARAATDIRHNLAAALTWDVPGAGPYLGGWSISGIGTFRSNRPYTIIWGDDRNGTTQNDARPNGRNTGQTDAFRSVDVALVRRFHLGSKVIEARAEAFNAFNTTNFDEYVGALLSPLFAQPVLAFPKQRVQLAAIVRF